MMRFVRSLIVVGAICASTSVAGAQAIDWQGVDDAFGRKAAVVSGEAHRYGFPRTDLSVTLDERLRVAPPMNDDAKGLSDDDLQNMANAIARLPPPMPPVEAGDPQRLARGNALAEQNHCNICHRSDFSGQENVPRLVNQREDYLLKTMRAYKTGARHAYDATMAEVLQPVDENDLGVLAYFLAHAQ